MKHVFIVNPESGKGAGLQSVKLIEEVCKEQGVDYEVVFSEFPGHSKEIAARYSIADDVCLYAVGGDGTAYEVLNGLQDGLLMAIIPAGSGNDFFGSLQKDGFDLRTVIRETINGENIKIDYGTANGLKWLNIVSVGFCALINYDANVKYKKKKWIPSSMVYIITALFNIFRPTNTKIQLIIDGKQRSLECLLVAIANGIRYGGGFKPAPNARIDDGIFDVCQIEFVKTPMILRLLPVYFKGTHLTFDIAHLYNGKGVTIIGSEEMYFNIDGEVLMAKDLEVVMHHQALNLRVTKQTIKELGC